MRTAVDTSALLSIFNGDPSANEWLRLLIAARRDGQLVICDVVYAEISCAFDHSATLDLQLQKMGVVFDPMTPATAFAAGRAFRAYRRRGGPREALIPDFLIAAHAECQADRLAAADRGYFRTCFAKLTVIQP